MDHHHRRKHSTASSSSNGMALSGKEEYKQLFNGANKKTQFRRGRAVEDSDEIFGAGVGSGRGSSLPVLNLSDIGRANGSDEVRDYSRIFGGLGGGAGWGLPPYEELFGVAHKSKSDKAKPRVTADLGSSMKESDNVKEYGLGSGCLPQVSNQSFDGPKQLNVSYHKTSQRGKHDSNGTTHIAQLNAVSGFTCFVNGDTHLQNQDHDKGIRPKETVTNDKMNTRDELSGGKSGRRVKCRLQNAQQASEGAVNRKDDVNRNLTGLNRRLFHSGEIDVESLKVPPPSSSSVDQSRPNGKLFYSGELDLKSRPSKAPPPSGSSSQHNDNKMHLNQSKSFASGSKADSPKKDDTGGYFSPSDEELDVDSAAAVSAAALKKAIQQAQESIRLAKEIMERKHNRMKTRSRSALKVKDVKETIHDQHVISVAEKNTDDACNVLETKVLVQTEYVQNKEGGNVKDNISAVKEKETFPVNRSGEAQRPEEHAETVGGGGMSLWFTQLLNNGKNRMSALASQLVDNKNNTILPEKSEKIEEANMTKEAVTLETNNSEKMDSVAGVLLPKAAESELSTFHRETYSDMNVDISGTNVFVKDANLNAQVHDKFEDGEKSEKKLDCEEIKDDRPTKKIICLIESTDEAKMVFKFEKEEALDAVFRLEENGSSIDAVDERKLGELSQVVDNEGQPKAANGKEIYEKLEDLAEVTLECNSQHKTDEQRPIHSHDGAGNQILSQEACFQKEFDPKIISKRQYESKDLGHRDVIESIQQKEIEVRKTGSWPDDANKNHPNSSFDSCDSDNLNMPSENVELRGLSMNFCNEQVSQPEDRRSVKDNDLAEDEEQACELVEGKNIEHNDDVEFEEDAYEVEQEVEGPFWLEESELSGTSYLNEGGEEDVLDTIGRNPESDDLECEEDEEQVEQAVEDAIRLQKIEFCETSYLDGNDEEGDVLQTLGRENEAIDDLERDVDEEEVEEAVEGAFRLKQNEKYKTYHLDQSSVQGDVLETIVQYVSEAHVSGDKTDSFGSATTTHEEIICEELPTDVDNDSDKDKSPPEMSPPIFVFSDTKVKIQIKEEDDHSNFPVDPENITVVKENEVCIGNIMEDVNDAPEKEAEMDNKVEDHQERDLVEKYEEPNLPMQNNCEGCQEHLEPDSVLKTGQSTECCEESLNRTEKESIETREAAQKETEINGYNDGYLRKIELVKKERERLAVERAIREARERAFAEARGRAERAFVEKANADARQRAISEAREKFGKVASGTKISKDEASSESKLKAERSAVERATAEARERALEKAMSQKSTSEARAPGGKVGAGKSPSVTTNTGLKHSVSSPNLEGSGESNIESAQRRKARLDRHQRIMERAEKALAEKNMRDILAQREQAERNRLAEPLDAEIKRWASGKEGNLRALLSTLQYILGTKNGWQPITLTEIITTSAVKKAYRKATLYVHPDKLQQRGASIRQKYICEKVFYLLQAAWNKLSSEGNK